MKEQYIKGPSGQIAYHYDERSSDHPPIIFLCGFKSDMMGSKAEWLSQFCQENNRSFLRFDYSAHGKSEGNFNDFTIGQAVDDTLFMIDHFIQSPAIIIGSSMGGWIGLRILELRMRDVYAFIGIAAAPDFTTEIKASLSDEQRDDLNEKGFFEEPSDYEEPYIFTQSLLEDGDVHCMLNRSILTDKPVHLIQGKLDKAVRWEKANRINEMLSNVATIHFIDDGDHSLSRPQDLEILGSIIKDI